MILHVTVGGPLFKALRALVRFLSRMYSDVISECARSGESLAANVTSVRSGTLVCFDVSEEVFIFVKRLVANVAGKHRVLSLLSLVDRVEAHVIVQILETFGHGLRREVQTIAALSQLLHQIPLRDFGRSFDRTLRELYGSYGVVVSSLSHQVA